MVLSSYIQNLILVLCQVWKEVSTEMMEPFSIMKWLHILFGRAWIQTLNFSNINNS